MRWWSGDWLWHQAAWVTPCSARFSWRGWPGSMLHLHSPHPWNEGSHASYFTDILSGLKEKMHLANECWWLLIHMEIPTVLLFCIRILRPRRTNQDMELKTKTKVLVFFHSRFWAWVANRIPPSSQVLPFHHLEQQSTNADRAQTQAGRICFPHWDFWILPEG